MRRLAALFALVTLPAASACVGEIVGYETTEGPIEEECPLAPVGSRCADSATLEVCDGKEVATVDCGATGQYCVEGPSGAACVGEGENCGDVTAEGTCTEEIHTSCVEGVVQVTDCAATGQGCGFLEATEASSGVFSAGCAKRPGEVSACVKDATGAALRTIQVGTRG